MAFFEQIGKRLTDVGQGVAQQTKNFTDVTRLNSVISEKERKISQLYAMLGQAYYEQHREDPAAEEAQTIEELNRTFAEIRQCQEEIRQIKGAVKCPNCGADAAPDALFCNACGARLPKTAVPAAETRTCPNCHAQVGKDNLFCNHCGTKLENPAEL